MALVGRGMESRCYATYDTPTGWSTMRTRIPRTNDTIHDGNATTYPRLLYGYLYSLHVLTFLILRSTGARR